MSYLELLKLASPEAVVVITALVVLAIGLTSDRAPVEAAVLATPRPGEGGSAARPNQNAGDTPATTATAFGLCPFIAGLGLATAVGAVLMLPRNATLFNGMLVVTPLTSLFKIVCIALAFFTVLLACGEPASRNRAEYLAMILLATVGLMLLVGSEELLMIFIGLELLGLSLYVMASFDKTDLRPAQP